MHACTVTERVRSIAHRQRDRTYHGRTTNLPIREQEVRSNFCRRRKSNPASLGGNHCSHRPAKDSVLQSDCFKAISRMMTNEQNEMQRIILKFIWIITNKVNITGIHQKKKKLILWGWLTWPEMKFSFVLMDPCPAQQSPGSDSQPKYICL